jgi:predicted glycogen debranching enzyme
VAVNGDLKLARREWLHTNGAGAYASSTLAGMHSRRYHGLLVAALDPPRGRHVFLSHVDATITLPRPSLPPPSPVQAYGPPSRAGRPRWELAKHQFPGVDPESGSFYLQRFDQDPLPRWTHAVAGGELEITLALVRGENAAVLRYLWRGPHLVQASLRPLLAARSFHDLQREHGGMLQRVELRAGEMRVQPRRDLPRICFRFEGTFVGSPDWWRRFEYLAERDRGLDYMEDLWTPGVFEVQLDGRPSWLVASVERLPAGEPEALFEAARAALLAEDPGPSAPMLQRRLTIAAEAYRADLALRPAIVAGYPWYEVRGRDALIALPGLYLVTRKTDGALRILREVMGQMQDGLVPSRIPDGGAAPEFHAADATLWLFEAARLCADTLGEGHPFVTDELLLSLRDAFEAMLRGTRSGIHVTADGLLAAGGPGDALTWMDARVSGRPISPRAGCPVELSALWARGCDTLARLARAAGDASLHARALAECRRARIAFRARFWCDETAYPYDVISEAPEGEGAFRDASIRPNAVIALAIDPLSFTPERATSILDRAGRELLTLGGLRTLSPDDPRYVGRYGGGVAARDGATHQGTAWPWLLGFYVRAARRSGRPRTSLESLVASCAANELALGHVPEMAEGDAPHAPAGCVARASGVAELLRALVWDLRSEEG